MFLYSASPNPDSCIEYSESKKMISLRSGFMIYKLMIGEEMNNSFTVIGTRFRVGDDEEMNNSLTVIKTRFRIGDDCV